MEADVGRASAYLLLTSASIAKIKRKTAEAESYTAELKENSTWGGLGPLIRGTIPIPLVTIPIVIVPSVARDAAICHSHFERPRNAERQYGVPGDPNSPPAN